jgi:uroporphyrin-3 C-methyltransferase
LNEAKHGFDLVNTDISEIENETRDAALENKKPKRKGGGISFLSLLMASAALAGTAWMWWLNQQPEDEPTANVLTEIARLQSVDKELSSGLQQLRNEMESFPSADHSVEISALRREFESAVKELEGLGQTTRDQVVLSRSLQAAAEAMQGRLLAAESALSGVAAQKLDAGGELDLAEVDYLLRLANERLKLFSDLANAEQALDMADQYLAAMNNPIYLGVRQAIAQARRELAAVTPPDYLAISNDLDALQQSTGYLSFKGDTRVSRQADEVEDEGWWQKLKGVFSGLVTVRRSTDEENDRISLEDKDFIRQRLWLQLEIAHLSLMRRDQAAFTNALSRVQKTLTEWFEEDSGVYPGVQDSLSNLVAQKIEVEVPDISAPWATLRLIREGRMPSEPPHPAAIPEQEAEPVSESADEESVQQEVQG